MPGPLVHLTHTARWAEEEGLSRHDSTLVGLSDIETDAIWPGRVLWGRHFNPMASLWYHPRYLREALRLKAAGGEHQEASLQALGRALHSKQDSIGHGTFGLSHVRHMLGLLPRNPDDWAAMPPELRARIEAATRAILRRYVSAPARRD